MSPWVLWIVAVVAPPLCVVALSRRALEPEQLRRLAAVGAILMVLAAAAVFVVPALGELEVRWPVRAALLGPRLFRVTAASRPLLLLPVLLWLVSIGITPRMRLDGGSTARNAAAALATTLAFLTDSPVLLVLLWIASSGLLVYALSAAEHRRARRLAALHLTLAAALFAAGVGCVSLSPGTVVGRVGLWLVLVAILIRTGVLPFHAWVPEVFDTGRLNPIVTFGAPQLGSYAALVFVVPHASPSTLRALAILSLLTAVHGAALALVQRDARRACGYLFVSQSALVLAGLDCTSPQALAGALVLWLSSSIAVSGLARALLAVELRRGTLDLTRHHGGYDQMPQLAVSFLVLGLACAGFPGTVGFIAQEMLIEGAVRDFPLLGLSVIVVGALTGLAVLRMYFSLFCGVRTRSLRQPLLAREVLVLGVVTAVLVVGGLLPRPIVASRLHASHAILASRGATAPH